MSPVVKAVTLSRKLVLERPLAAPDGAGGFARSWETLGTVWAEVQPRSGRSRDGGEMSLSSARYKITLRATPVGSEQRPTPACRFRDGDRIFTIEAVTEADGVGRYLVCHATEEVAQ
ncbi:head-tail adaptor protein [Shimia sp. R10_1]|uniref:head-tail adaptor protein n=1 Tax=Shimia sp. R10_1 TaxID=2821095 RepID=UPI001AD9EA00|nr:head-tail adaptor protein [Shimia sp. R10_1]MBO9472020.1 head-tail adaptor protein [Shimia sp. R10_1]